MLDAAIAEAAATIAEAEGRPEAPEPQRAPPPAVRMPAWGFLSERTVSERRSYSASTTTPWRSSTSSA